MRDRGLLLVISIICCQNSVAQWVQISTISTNQLTAVKFLNVNSGAAVGYGGIWRTTDGGFNWSPTLQVGRFNAVSFSDSINGTAVGDSGIIYKTTNNGINWTQETSPTTLNLYSVSCPTLNNRFAIGRNGVFLRWFVSSWNLISTLGTDYYDIKMQNANDGYIVGSSSNEIVRNTANGGTNWILSFQTSGRLNSIFPKNSNTIVCVGINSRIRISTNYGYNWSVPIVDSGYTFYSVTFPVWDTGYVAGSGGIIYRSVNGGYNWTRQMSNVTYTLRSISFINSKTGWIVGDNGVVLKTTTGGVTSLTSTSQAIPDEFKLYQNYPNPFNLSTIIKFDLKDYGSVGLNLYDMVGKHLCSLIGRSLAPGLYTYNFEPTEFPSGIYFYKLSVIDAAGRLIQTESKRMVIAK